MTIRWLALLVVLLGWHVASAAPDAAPVTSDAPPMEQVDVEAKRAKLHALAAQLYALEDQFFAQYNQVNDERAFKVNCGWQMRQHFRVHRCNPAFMDWPDRTAINYSYAGNSTIGWWEDPNVRLLRIREYQRHLVATVSRHPELLPALKERDELAGQYRELRQQLFADKTFKWD